MGAHSGEDFGGEECRMISSALIDIKKCFRESDPEFHSLETIEQSVESLLEKLSSFKKISISQDDLVTK